MQMILWPCTIISHVLKKLTVFLGTPTPHKQIKEKTRKNQLILGDPIFAPRPPSDQASFYDSHNHQKEKGHINSIWKWQSHCDLSFFKLVKDVKAKSLLLMHLSIYIC
jgi:hypothetical protein